jgi:hypothetical protein
MLNCLLFRQVQISEFDNFRGYASSSNCFSLTKWGDAHVFASWMHLFCAAIDTQCIFVGKLISAFCVKSLSSLTRSVHFITWFMSFEADVLQVIHSLIHVISQNKKTS